MKLKYKKVILLTTISTMGIGLLTLSVSNDRTQAKDNISTVSVQEAGLLADAGENDLLASLTLLPTTIPAPTLSPTPLPINAIEEEEYPEIKQLFVDFYAAKNNRDVDKIKVLLSDPTQVETQEELQKKTQYIEEYTKIKTYTKKGYEEGTYIVYVYHEIKFTGINTAAPGLSKFYLVTGTDGKLKIFSGEMDETTKAYYDARNTDEDVLALIDMTNEKSQKAIEKDEDLQNFWENIDQLANKNDEQAEGDSAE